MDEWATREVIKLGSEWTDSSLGSYGVQMYICWSGLVFNLNVKIVKIALETVSKCLEKFEYVKYAYLEPYWSQPPVFHLNIRHSVKAGVHLKQKVNLKFKSSNSLSETYIKGMLWKMEVFVINLNSKNYQKNFKGKAARKFYIFSGQFIQQMSRDMINLIISGGDQPLFLCYNIPDKIFTDSTVPLSSHRLPSIRISSVPFKSFLCSDI